MPEIKKIGLVVMGNISVGGGYPRVVYDLITVLNELGKEVYLLTPFSPDYKKIEQLYGPIKIKKVYALNKVKSIFSIEDVIRRKLMKREFKKMANEVDFIFDICGRVMDKYLPKNFDKNNYVIWALTTLDRGEWKKFNNFVRNIKEIIQMSLSSKKFLPSKDVKIYAFDQWTKENLITKCSLNPDEQCLYPPIHIEDFRYRGNKKKNQIVVNGRINPIKRIEDSINIFYEGTKNNPEYNLVILGGMTPESEAYIKYLGELAEKLSIKDRVKIIKDPSFNQVKEELLNSKILIDSERDVNLTMTSIEAMAAGNIILGYKNSNNYKEILEEGKYGYGFLSVEEGSNELKKILKKMKEVKYNNMPSIERSKFFSREKFVERVKKIIGEENEK
jgi:glycosyltransferase involved in cell wall biosynthesis